MVNEIDLQTEVQTRLQQFWETQLEKLSRVTIFDLLRKTNPYLAASLSGVDPEKIVHHIVESYMASSHESTYGNKVTEPIARWIAHGEVSAAPGWDFATPKPNQYTIYEIKSSPAAFNSQGKHKQDQNARALGARTRKDGIQFEAVVAYTYGYKNPKPGNWSFRELVGRDFWSEISGDPDCYTKVFRAIVSSSRLLALRYEPDLQAVRRRLLNEFEQWFCHADGAINWTRILEFNSGSLSRKDIQSTRKQLKPKLHTPSRLPQIIRSLPSASRRGLTQWDRAVVGLSSVIDFSEWMDSAHVETLITQRTTSLKSLPYLNLIGLVWNQNRHAVFQLKPSLTQEQIDSTTTELLQTRNLSDRSRGQFFYTLRRLIATHLWLSQQPYAHEFSQKMVDLFPNSPTIGMTGNTRSV